MEEGLDRYLERTFALEEKDFSQYSPLTLAYIGDAVYGVIIRTILVRRGNRQTDKLHTKESTLVRASAQAQMIAALKQSLSEEERSVYRRGRNASPDHTAKNASRREYLEATGFEALIGSLYLKREYRRMVDLIFEGVNACGFEL